MVESVVRSHAEITVGSIEKLIRVLHVDDEPGLLKVAKQCLELQGAFQIDTAGSVEEALVKLEKKQYDAVVSDYQMPGKDGLEFLEMLRKNGNTIPFIMFTGKGREEVAVKAWSLGADHYVNKTGDPEIVYYELAHCLRSTVEKRFAEAQAKETVQKLQTIYQNAVEGITYVDAEENIVYANKAFADVIGYEQDQLAGMSLRKILDDENWAKIESETKRRRQGESGRYELEFRRRDGTVRNAMVSGAPLLDHDGRFAGTVGIVLDVTERKKAEEESKKSEEKYRRIFESANDVILYVDKMGIIIDINETAKDVFGYNRNELIGKNVFTSGFIDLRQLPKMIGVFRSSVDKNEVLDTTGERINRMEVGIRHKEGHTVLVEASTEIVEEDGNAIGFLSVLRDITERKKAEEALRESEAKYRDLFENAMDAIVTLDVEGSITAVNSSVLRFGYKKEDLVGKNILDFVSKEYWQAVMRDFSKVAQGEPAKNEVELIAPAGKTIVEYHARAMVKENNVAGVQINIRDMTERKKAEEALRLSEEKYRGLFENARDVIVLLDLKGNVTSINKVAEEEYGFKNSEILGKSMLKFVPKKHWPKLLSGVAQIALGKTAKGKIDISTPKGDKIAEYRSNPIFSDDRVVGIQTILEDVTEREVMEKTIRESEEKWRSLVELAPDGMVAVNVEGTITSANRSFLTLVGYDSEEEIAGKPFAELMTIRMEDIPKFQGMFKSLMKGESLSPSEFLYVRRDGMSRWAEVHPGLMTKDGRPVGVQAIMRDVTERKNAEKLVQESHQKFEGLFRHNPEAAVYLDAGFNIVDVNPRFCQLFGYSGEEAKGKNIDDLVVPEGLCEEAESLNKDAKNGYASHNTIRKRKDGSVVPVSISAAPVTFENNLLGYVGIYKDITDLKRAQEESEESRKHFQTLFDLMADPVAVVDGRGKILEVTQKVEEITGFKKEELVGKNLLKVKMFGAKTKAVMIKSLAKRMMGMHVEPYEVEVIKKDGGELLYEINAAKIDYRGKPADLVVFRDIMERKNLEEKLRIVGSLTRHDVRNKLSAITGNIYLHKKKLVDRPDVLEGFKDMESACEQIVRIFEFARDYERLGVEELGFVDVETTVGKAASSFSDLKGVRIVNECHGLAVVADSLLERLFYNMIDNSLKHGEKLTQIRTHYEKSEDQLKLVYEDDGVGIPEDNKAKLFDEGFTTGKGSGYGLYLIKRMMDVYGWTISETGTHGKGAQFTINVPKTKPDGRHNYKLS